MASQKLFITGATGYIGGSVLEAIVHKFPALQITALLRVEPPAFKERYPNVQVVQGSFDDFAVIEKATTDADIIIHTGDIDHEGCANAILSGLSKKTTKGFLIHLSGTGCIFDLLENARDGKANPKIWSDIDDIEKIYNLPDEAPHHKIDRNIADASNDLIKTVTICPPDIYGPGKGVGGRYSFMVPLFVETILKTTKEPFYLGAGENMRAITHIDDVVSLFILILENALRGGGDVTWGREGFYFAVADEIPWKPAAEAICQLGKAAGWLGADITKAVSYDAKAMDKLLPNAMVPSLALYLWGLNSRADSARARKLGWEPTGDFWTVLKEDVERAVERVNKEVSG
ncbi:hypothetical protein AJ80_04870 [Polytolypa hystricis UAMH7299]|uniref:Uncharacterized protein n=1 Tax=Polytolypa hystricis (strain UAMH7299) TaxID=1447883 RepID=A0A2B7Y8H4_POLH7|nr:hypothetical protein AJ80_04870 [Polytolypa hystricis UAMH7299]